MNDSFTFRIFVYDLHQQGGSSRHQWKQIVKYSVLYFASNWEVKGSYSPSPWYLGDTQTEERRFESTLRHMQVFLFVPRWYVEKESAPQWCPKTLTPRRLRRFPVLACSIRESKGMTEEGKLFHPWPRREILLEQKEIFVPVYSD